MHSTTSTLIMHSTTSTLTLTDPKVTKSYKGESRKCAKSNYIIEEGLIWERNCCPGGDTRVACYRWTVLCGARAPRFESRGNPPFSPLPFRGDSLETKRGPKKLGLAYVHNFAFSLPIELFQICHIHSSKCLPRVLNKVIKGRCLFYFFLIDIF